ncbi:MAG TPA: response regulator [Moorella mulderi]|nr:response regulator [Moorella mulderi]
MSMKIRVLIVDDIEHVREELRRLLSLEDDIEVIGEAADGLEALQLTEKLSPHIVLMDVGLPKMDGLAATEVIGERFLNTGVVIVSIHGEQEYIRRAMAAGAGEYIVKPFSAYELTEAVRRVWERTQKLQTMIASRMDTPVPEGEEGAGQGQMLLFTGSKGGIGRTTLACNLAVLLAQRGKKVCLVDLDMTSGDVPFFFGLERGPGLSDLAYEEEWTPEVIEGYLVGHTTGVKILRAGEVTPDLFLPQGMLKQVVQYLRKAFQFVLVDLPPFIVSPLEEVFPLADKIFVVGRGDPPGLRRLKMDVDFLQHQGYQGEILPVVNQICEDGFNRDVAERALGRKLAAVIPADFRSGRRALRRGSPLVMEARGSRFTQALENWAGALVGEEIKKGFWARLFGR